MILSKCFSTVFFFSCCSQVVVDNLFTWYGQMAPSRLQPVLFSRFKVSVLKRTTLFCFLWRIISARCVRFLSGSCLCFVHLFAFFFFFFFRETVSSLLIVFQSLLFCLFVFSSVKQFLVYLLCFRALWSWWISFLCSFTVIWLCFVHLGYTRYIPWMLCDDQKCPPAQDR